ncbi:hypothetical protein CRENBAI_019299 [Crenichthys baileyi]|uniref:Uncharacterized protein n=1 Tax=Crenichthys baileyi TaxID=28760 RepID=A0AAV9QZD6_9TELE
MHGRASVFKASPNSLFSASGKDRYQVQVGNQLSLLTSRGSWVCPEVSTHGKPDQMLKPPQLTFFNMK